MNQSTELRRQLIEEGYCCLPGVASKGLIDKIRTVADRTAERSQRGTSNTSELQGSIIDVLGNPEMAPLISLPSAQKALCELGFPSLKFYSGYIISKPPEIAPALFWHQDGFVWDDPISYTDTPVQFFLMYYLIDTNQNNGCLRVIPGSHRKRHRLHGLPPAHSKEIQNATDGHPALEFDPDEVCVPVKAGDLVVGDARILHSAHANRSNQRRTVITLWFCPTYYQLPDTLQAIYGKPRSKPTNWTDKEWGLVEPLLVTYRGSALPVPHQRVPDERLV
ncbi:MAG: hypothetical protein DF168_00759 [Candidatus Moanabacter tarae]|uniref:Phytanoyl-CoA dioxygenase family protein n=1 Tax=Candidatus Moanibacter tarae TaxID=2200854 RepID=A0A2Z4AF24_9BACT|nr:MAG: hypothetical protein DF168_00759 [Candidatus Moanabacter tarae]|tara:strand:- start:2873 stop:3706 length:834 start_codon:yes stop_codon:yes gene_type:complete